MDPNDKEVWQVACELLTGYGARAPAAARRHANERLGDDDIVGHGVWSMVADACKELLRKKPDGERLN
jgi:hypothetical protein